MCKGGMLATLRREMLSQLLTGAARDTGYVQVLPADGLLKGSICIVAFDHSQVSECLHKIHGIF